MGFQTWSGSNPAGSTTAPAVQANGYIGLTAGQTVKAAYVNADDGDGQSPSAFALLSGILGTCTCTVSSLNVTIPSGTQYYARTVWLAGSAVVQAVGDNATTYIWGCSDGIIRTTSSTTPPTLFDGRSACLIVKATAVSGVVTLDLTVQQKGRYADYAARIVYDGGMVINYLAGTVTLPNGTVTSLMLLHPSRTITADSTATTADELIIIDVSSGNVTLTLPLHTAGLNYLAVKFLSLAHTNTVTTTGGELIDGASTFVASEVNQALEFRPVGAGWGIFPVTSPGTIPVTAPLVNSGGTLSIPASTNSVAGYLTAADHTTFSAVDAAAGTGSLRTLGTGSTQAAAGNHTHANATTSVAGFESAADKTNLDALVAAAKVIRTANPAVPAILGGASGTVTVTWPTAFADANYRVEAVAVDASVPLALSVNSASKTTSGCTITVMNVGVGALLVSTATLDVVGVHD